MNNELFWKKVRRIVRSMRMRNWELVGPCKKIRSTDKACCCPLSSVVSFGSAGWMFAANILRLDSHQREIILLAADRDTGTPPNDDFFPKQLRRIFLKAARLYQ